MKSITEKAYAKINLHLDITGRAENGYHLVDNVMQSISLCDDVTVSTRADGAITVECNVAGVPVGNENIAVRAAKLYCEKTGIKNGFDISIYKRIPMAAGMAGGSTDAAALLRAVNKLCGDILSNEELCSLGAMLGADIPFCVKGGSAYADGKGDILHEFSSMPDCYIVAACGGEGVSTPWAYGLLDKKYADFRDESVYQRRGIQYLEDAVASGDICRVATAMYNVFEGPIIVQRPVAKRILEQMKEEGAIGAMMSGSGPSVFGVFSDKDNAEKTAEKICQTGNFACVCTPVNDL